MSRRRVARLASTASMTLAVLGVLVTGTVAWSQTSVEAGWWTTAPVALAPDAPEGGLVVQGGPDPAQPLAFAAVSYAATGGTPASLTLTVASGSASTPAAALALCPLTNGFVPQHGGAADAAPGYDCATKVTASPAADGASYAFDVASLVTDGALRVAILPTAATDRVVLAPPDEGAVERSAGTTAGSTDDAFAPDDLATGEPTSSAGDAFALPPVAPSTELPTASPVAGTDAATARATGSSTDLDGSRPAVQAAATGDDGDDGSPVGAPLMIGLAFAAAALWYVAGSERPPLATGDDA